MVYLLWCVFGGLLLHMLEANYLTILLKPNYEPFVDTAEDILHRSLTVIVPPGSESILEIDKNSPSSITKEIANRTKVAKVIFCYIENI